MAAVTTTHPLINVEGFEPAHSHSFPGQPQSPSHVAHRFHPTWHHSTQSSPPFLYKNRDSHRSRDSPAASQQREKQRKTETKAKFLLSLEDCVYRNLMGNCLRREGSAAKWAGEEWDFLATDGRTAVGGTGRAAMKVEDEKEGLLGDCDEYFSASPPAATATEVKIKITKKQLEELLGKVDIKELSVQQVLTQLINVGGQFHESHHRAWRPVLQSIPEVN